MFVYNESTHDIYYIKGDTAHFSIEVSPFKPEEGDILNFTVKKRYGAPALISLTADNDMMFHLSAADYSADMAPGDYLYDIQLTTGQGEIYTLVGPARFEMDIEITTPLEPEPAPDEEMEG